MNTTTATPAEIDSEISRLQGAQAPLMAQIMGGTKRRPRSTDVADPIAAYEKLAAQLAPLHQEYQRRGGWTRWYLITDGHFHRDASWSRCSRTPSSDNYWLTEYSGRTEAEMIELAADRVCTVCFPNAPVIRRRASARFMTRTEAERAAHREEKARQAAAKKAAQITTPDGHELIVSGDHLKTERAAWNRAMQEATSLAWYGDDDHTAREARETIAACVAALAHRRNVTEQSLIDELNTKIERKLCKDGATVAAKI